MPNLLLKQQLGMLHPGFFRASSRPRTADRGLGGTRAASPAAVHSGLAAASTAKEHTR